MVNSIRAIFYKYNENHHICGDAGQLLLYSGPDATIIRPGMIVGKEGQGYSSVVSNAKKKTIFVLGSGKQKFQSIAVTDLAYYPVGILDDSRTYRQAFDVGAMKY